MGEIIGGPGFTDEEAEAKARLELTRECVESYLKIMLSDHVVPALRWLLHNDDRVRCLFRDVVTEEARELLREWRAAHPAGSVISRGAIESALCSVLSQRYGAIVNSGDIDIAVESLKGNGYFIV